jgi:uncharacterized protein YggE
VAEQPFIAVVGTGVATGTPDQCILQIALNYMADNAADALTNCADIASMALAAVREVDMEQHDVQTTGLSLQDHFDQSKQRVTARIATYLLDVTARPVNGVGSILAVLGASAGDALQIRGIRLSMHDPEPLRTQARRLAVGDAQRKAAELSQAAGIRLGAILALEDDNSQSRVPSVRRAMTMSASPASSVPIEPGEVSAVSTVMIRYAIEQ